MDMYKANKIEAWLCRISAGFYGIISPWKKPVGPTFAPLKLAFHLGLRTGDIEFAVVSARRFWLLWFAQREQQHPDLTRSIHHLSPARSAQRQSGLLECSRQPTASFPGEGTFRSGGAH